MFSISSYYVLFKGVEIETVTSWIQKNTLLVSTKQNECFLFHSIMFCLKEWKSKLLPPGYKKMPCVGFGRKVVHRTPCGDLHEPVWRTLDNLGIVYFPKVGSDLGAVRNSAYLSSDGDMDVYVDMPQKALLKEM